MEKKQTKHERYTVAFYNLLARIWSTGVVSPTKKLEASAVDLVVATSYCTTKKALTIASQKNLEIAMQIAAEKNALLAWASCSYPFNGAESIEDDFRLIAVAETFEEEKLIIGTAMTSTVTEAASIKQALNRKDVRPKVIVVVTGRLHARSARYIWRHFFPDAEILIAVVNEDYESQFDHPVNVQRNPWVWFAVNVARQILLWTLPMEWVARMKHNAS